MELKEKQASVFTKVGKTLDKYLKMETKEKHIYKDKTHKQESAPSGRSTVRFLPEETTRNITQKKYKKRKKKKRKQNKNHNNNNNNNNNNIQKHNKTKTDLL